ncbi:MAG: glycosyltransferase [Ilumatobacteraceae bacterium]
MPRFSIITPVYEPPSEAFESCINSVLAQTDSDWEWCLCNDASPSAWVAERLARLQTSDSRIRVISRATNGGIVAASNDAIASATGEFLVLLDNDDELRDDALELVAAALSESSEIDYVYSDEDKIAPTGERFDAFQKPIWSPERLLAQNYTSHLSVLRRAVVDEVGRFRTGFDGSQDYDLVLRVIERARRIANVPEVLYHWRALPTSTASAAAAKPYAFIAALRAVREHLERRGLPAEVTEAGPSLARVRRRSLYHPFVSVVTVADGTTERIYGVSQNLGNHLVSSVAGTSTYRNFELVIVVPATMPEDQRAELVRRADGRGRIVQVDAGASLAHSLNNGLVAAKGEYVAFIDQHCELINTDWIETLLGYIDQSSVALVAPQLLDEYGVVYSAGLGLTPEPHHIARGRLPTDYGPVGMFAIARECFGVSTACVVAKATALRMVGGFSPEYSGRTFDFDLACKLHQQQLHAIVTPLVAVRYLGDDAPTTDDLATFKRRWGRYAGRDPYTRIDTRMVIPAAS